MSLELNSANGGTELHLETYTNPSEQVDTQDTVDIYAHEKTEYLVFHIN